MFEIFGGSSINEKETKREQEEINIYSWSNFVVDCVYLFTYLLLGMNHVGIHMLLSEYILSGRRNIARTGKDGAETDSHEDRRILYLLRSLDYYYYYYYYY
jgi:hypothetical protein